MEIAFTEFKSGLSPRDLLFQVAAIDKQMREHFAPAYGLEPWPCTFYATLPDPTSPPSYHPLFVSDDINAPGAAGFHDDIKSSDGLLDYIYGRVMTPTDPLDASTGSHESIEMRDDPTCDQYAPAPLPSGQLVADEPGDPVEADAYPIEVTIEGETRTILVSNFVLPSYFIPGSQGPWDYMGRLTGPAPAMTSGGYLILMDPASGQLSNLYADRAGARRFAARRIDPHSRTARRIKKAHRAMLARMAPPAPPAPATPAQP